MSKIPRNVINVFRKVGGLMDLQRFMADCHPPILPDIRNLYVVNEANREKTMAPRRRLSRPYNPFLLIRKKMEPCSYPSR